MTRFAIFNRSVCGGLLLVVGLSGLASIAPSVSQARPKRTMTQRVAALETAVAAQGARMAKLSPHTEEVIACVAEAREDCQERSGDEHAS